MKDFTLGGDINLTENYHAFISYSHETDSSFSKIIHQHIETFGTPVYKSRQLRIFMDDSSLKMTNDLWKEIEYHLGKSDYLLILLSPGTRNSEWVEKEIKSFVTNRGSDSIGLILTEGKSPWTDKGFNFSEKDAAISPEIVDILGYKDSKIQPFIIDLRNFRYLRYRFFNRSEWDSCIATIVSAVSKEDKDTLFGRHIKRLRQRIMLFSILMVGLCIATATAFWFEKTARNRALIAESRALSANALVEVDENPDRAVLLSEHAFSIFPSKEARHALFRSLITHGNLCQATKSLPNNAVRLILTKNKERIIAFNGSNLYRIYHSKDLKPVTEILTIPGNTQTFSMAISSNGQVIAAGKADGKLLLIEAGQAKIVGQIDIREISSENPLIKKQKEQPQLIKERIRSLAFNETDNLIAVAIGNHIVCLSVTSSYKPSIKLKYSLKEIHMLRDIHGSTVNFVDFLPDGRIISNGWDSQIRIWSGKNFSKERLLLPKTGSNESPVRFTPDGKWATAVSKKGLHLWNLDTYTLIRKEGFEIPGGQTTPRLGSLSQDGKLIAAASWDSGAFIWDVQTGSLATTPLTAHAGNAIETIFLPETHKVLTSGTDQRFYLWDVSQRYPFVKSYEPSLNVDKIAFAENGYTFAVTGSTNGIKLVRLYTIASNGSLILSKEIKTPHSGQIAISSDSNLVAFSKNNHIFLWKNKAIEPEILAITESPVTALSFRSNDSSMVSGHEDGSIAFWDTTDGSEKGKIPYQSAFSSFVGHHVSQLKWYKNNTLLLVANSDGNLRVRDMVQQRWIKPVDPNPHKPIDWSNFSYFNNEFVAVSKSLNSLFVVCEDKLQIFNLHTGLPKSPEIVMPLRSHIAMDIAYNSELQIFAVVMGKNVHGSATNGPVLLFDSFTGQVIAPPLDKVPAQKTVAISNDGKWMVTGGIGGLNLWDMDIKTWRTLAKEIAGRNLTELERIRYAID